MDIDFNKMNGLVPAIIQDSTTRKVLMLGFMNEEAYRQTLATKRVTFWSRTRSCLWTKGETSGNYLELVSLKADCDNDTLLVEVIPHGPTCHKGTDTCWGETNDRNPLLFLTELQDFIYKRHEEMPEGSYTNERLIYECSDMLYHLIVLLTSKGLRIEQIAKELEERHKPSWHKH